LFDHQDAIILATARDTTQLASTAAERTGLSRVAVSRRIKKLADAGYLTRHGTGTRQTYTPGQNRFWLAHTTREAVSRSGGEFGVWEAHVAPLMQGMPDAVVNLANIAFTEMLNNALDHSQAQHLLLAAHANGERMQMLVADDGVGIFRQIAQAMDLFDDRLALLELAKGKFTTAATGHSGMGVFVSSRMLDGMAIQSRGLTFDLHTGSRALGRFDWVDATSHLKNTPQGTTVRMDLALDTTRTAQDVYNRYFTPDEVGNDAFHTTEVPVRLAQLSSQLTSRSQGKWVVERATQFKTVVLDFEGVALVGQGFVDEVFRVFATAHPQVRLKPIHLVPDVARAMAMFAPHVALPPAS
jgi:anti-sigma regulatory factor (Ser/Thr protein kinase)